MTTAFVLINAESGVEGEVLRQIQQIVGVAEARIVYGVYYIVAKVEGSTPEDVREIVIKQIRYLDHIQATLTLLVVEP